MEETEEELVYFWGIGDLHYRVWPEWRKIQERRYDRVFQDLDKIWRESGKPAFCASPGDLVETGDRKNYELARQSLKERLGDLPLFPGLGNHEYYSEDGEDLRYIDRLFTETWEKPVRYSWVVGEVLCIMLDYPNPFLQPDVTSVGLIPEALAFLEQTLSEHPEKIAIIFSHNPLANTVLDRDPRQNLDYNTTQSFFSLSNSQEVRELLGRYSHACLFISGHTHSGWEAPGIVVTEELNGHPITFLNLMSPWYTGTRGGPKIAEDQSVIYTSDEPDVAPSFSLRISRSGAEIRLREHLSGQWLKSWRVPFVIP